MRKPDTFWFTAACEENLSPAALTLSLPKFMKEAGAGLETGEKKSSPKENSGNNLQYSRIAGESQPHANFHHALRGCSEVVQSNLRACEFKITKERKSTIMKN